MPEKFINSLKERMDGENKPEMDITATVSTEFTDYVEAVIKFRRKLEREGCPLCGSRIETRLSKFWFIIWDQWICTGVAREIQEYGMDRADGIRIPVNVCPHSEEVNDIFVTYEKYKEGTDGNSNGK